MCIIVAKYKEVALPNKKTLKNCFNNNPDGAGFMYVENESIIIEKGFFKFDNFYKAVSKHKDKNVIMHFRIATEGSVKKDNCHPFLINSEFAMAHNGVLNLFKPEGDKTDSQIFGDNILKRFGKEALKMEELQFLIGETIGAYSKLAFLTCDDDIIIINSSKGVFDGGCWYSNQTYKYTYEKHTTNQYSWKKGGYGYYDDNYYPTVVTDDDSIEKRLKAFESQSYVFIRDVEKAFICDHIQTIDGITSFEITGTNKIFSCEICQGLFNIIDIFEF